MNPYESLWRQSEVRERAERLQSWAVDALEMAPSQVKPALTLTPTLSQTLTLNLTLILGCRAGRSTRWPSHAILTLNVTLS